MAVNLETLVLEFQADFTKFDRSLDHAANKARVDAKKLEKLYRLTPQINPVDDSNLRKLSSVKVKLVDTDSINNAVNRLKQVKSIEITERYSNARQKEPKSMSEKVLTSAFKKAMGTNFSLNPLSFLKNSFDSSLRGFREQIGASFASKLTQGYINNIEKSIGRSLTDLSETSAGLVSAFVGDVKTEFLKSLGLSEAQLVRKLTRISGNIQTYIVPRDDIVAQVARVSKVVSKSLGSVFDGTIIADTKRAKEVIAELAVELGNLADIPRSGFVQLKEDRLQVAAKLAQRRAREITTDPSKTDKTVLASGGFAGENGRSSHALAKVLRRLLNGTGTTVIPVENKATDTSNAIAANPVKWMADAIARAIEFNLIRGYNPDAVEAAAVGAAVKRDNPDAEVSMIGHSAGGAVAQEFNAISSIMGNPVKSVGIGTPENFFTEIPSASHKQLLTDLDGVRRFAHILKLIGFNTKPNKPEQSLPSNRHSHYKAEYLSNPATVPFVNDALPKDTQLKDESFLSVTNTGTLVSIAESFEVIQQLLESLPTLNPKIATNLLSLHRGNLQETRSDLLGKVQDSASDRDLASIHNLLDTLEVLDNALAASKLPIAGKQIISIFDKVYLATAKLSGVKVNPKDIPQVQVGNLPAGQLGMFKNGTVQVSPSTIEEAAKLPEGESKELATLVHEIRHALQPSLKPNQLLTLDKLRSQGLHNAANAIQEKALQSVRNGANANLKISPAQAKKMLAMEIDAYMFEFLFSGKIKDSVRALKQEIPNFEEELFGIVDALKSAEAEASQAVSSTPRGSNNNLLGANAPKNKLANYKASIINGSGGMEQRLADKSNDAEFTVDGLKKLARFLDIDNKEIQGFDKVGLAKLISKQETLKLISAIDKLGNDIRSKTFIQKNELASSNRQNTPFGVDAAISSVRSNRAEFSEAVDSTSALPKSQIEDKKAALTAINNLLGLQLREIARIKQEYKLTTAQSQELKKAKIGILNTQRKLANSVNTESVGKDFTEGFKIGIDSKLSDQAAFEMGTSSIKALRKAIKSRSPSLETIKAGEDAGEGYALGWLKRLNRAKNAAKAIGLGSIEALVEASRTTGFSDKESSVLTKMLPKGELSQIAKFESELQSKGVINIDNFIIDLQDYIKASQQVKEVNKDGLGFKALKNTLNIFRNSFRGSFSDIKDLGKTIFPEITANIEKSLTELSQSTSVSDLVTTAPKALLRSLNLESVFDLFTESRGRKINAFLTAIGLIAFKDQLASLGKALFQTAMEFDVLDKKLTAIGMNDVDIFETFGDSANRAGIRIEEFASSYAGMVASLKGKVSNPRSLFNDIAIGLSDRGVVGDSQGRALTAISQMAAKGVVSMEELRQQLSEALPGAFSIAAESMGLTEKQMISLVGSGQLLSTEFLPKFAKELQKTSNSTVSLNKEVAKFQNTSTKIKLDAASLLPFTKGMQLLNFIFSGLSAIAKPLFTVLGIVAVSALVNLTVHLGLVAKSLSLLKFAGMAVSGVFVPLLAVTAGLYAGFKIFDMIMVGSANSTQKLNKELRKLATEGLKEAKEESKGYRSDNWIVRARSATSDKLWGKLGLETMAGREERVNREAIQSGIPVLHELNMEFKVATADSEIESIADELAVDLKKARKLAYDAANRQELGISLKDAELMQKEATELTEAAEQKVSQKFKVPEMEAALKDIEARRLVALKELEKGADTAKYTTIMAELDINETSIRESLDKAKRILVENTLTIQLSIAADSLQNTISKNLDKSNAEDQLKLYKEMASTQAHSRVEEARARKLTEKSRQTELALIKEAAKAQVEFINNIGAGRTGRLQSLLGTDDIFKATPQQIESAKLQLAKEETLGATPDLDLKESIEKLEQLSDGATRLKNIQAEQAKFQYETIKIIKELNIELSNLELEKAEKLLSARELSRDVTRRLDPTKNEQVFTLGQELKNQSHQLKRGILDQRLAYTQAVISIEDFRFQLTNSTKELVQRIKQTARDIYTLGIQGVGDYLNAAGIEDLLGLGKIRELVTKAVGITSSDQRPTIQREIETEDRSFNRQKADFERQRQSLTRQVEDNIFNITNQQSELGRRIEFNPEDTKIDLDRLLLQIQRTAMDISTTNRNINGANLSAKEYGVNRQVGQIDVTLPSVAELKDNPEAIINQIKDIQALLYQANKDAIKTYRQIEKEGTATLSRGLAEATDAYKSKAQTQQQQLETEGRRVTQANTNLSREISGSMLALQQNVSKAVVTIQQRNVEARKAFIDFFKGYGMGQSQSGMEKQALSQVNAEIEAKLFEYQNAKLLLEKMLTSGADKGSLIASLSSEDAAESIDPAIRQQLMQDLNNAVSDEDYLKVVNKIAELSKTYSALSGNLEDNSEALRQAATERATRAGKRKIEDLKFEEAQEYMAGQYFQTDSQKALMQIAFDESKAKLELDRQIQDMQGEFAPEVIAEVEERLTNLNKVKFDRLKYEASDTFKIIQGVKDGLESSLSSAFVNLGQNLFKPLSGDKRLQELEANKDYADKLREAQEQYADDPGQLQKVSERLEMLNNVKLDGIKNEFSVFGAIIGTIKQAVLDFAQTMLQTFAKIAAQKVATSVLSGVFGGGFLEGGEVGEVQNFASGGIVGAIDRAMVREGVNAIPIVAHKGEQILTTRNGDAQFFRAMQKNGLWDELKNGGVSNFNVGGIVGGSGTSANVNRVTNTRHGNNVNITTNYNMVTKENGFKKSHSQAIAEAEERNQRYYTRNK